MYKKKFINEIDYKIISTSAKGGFKTVNENQDLYQDWLAKGNELEVIPYVAPVIPDKSKSDLLSIVQASIKKTTQSLLQAGFEFAGINFSLHEQAKNTYADFATMVSAGIISLPYVIDGSSADLEITSETFQGFIQAGFGTYSTIISTERQLLKDVEKLTKVNLKTWTDSRVQ